jgi:two-component system, LuxR family, sensor kinase FixL
MWRAVQHAQPESSVLIDSNLGHSCRASARPQPNIVASLFEFSAFAGASACSLLYYIAAEMGLAFKFSGASTAVWPASALLLAVLLLLPVRHWWIALLSIVPAHLAAHAGLDQPMWRLVWQMGHTGALAIPIAVALRRVIDAQRPLGTVRNLIAYLGISASASAAVALIAPHTLRTWLGFAEPKDEAAILAWCSVYLANFVAIVTMTPAMFLWASHGAEWLRCASRKRCMEVMFIGALAIAAYIPAFLAPQAHAPLYILGIAALWAAARFGIAGAASAMFVIASLSVAPEHVPHSLLTRQAPIAEAIDLQIFLMGVSLTVLFLAVLIEERDRSAELLRQSVERFQIVLRATNDIIFDWDIKGGRLWWSANGKESLANVSDWLNRIHADDRGRYLQELLAMLHGRESAWEIEYAARHDGDTMMHTHERASILRLPNGEAERMIGSIVDITDRKRLDDAHRTLARAARLTSLGKITACIAHEVNQPLGAILNNVEAALLLLRSGTLSTTELEQILLDVRNDDVRATEVIRRLCGLLQDRKLESQAVDLNEIVQDVAYLVRADAQRQCITLQLHCEPIPFVKGNRVHLQQVLLNLVLNSMDALSATPKPQRCVNVHTESLGGDIVQVRVVDQGCGILPEHLPKVFDSFYTTKESGLGLGLSIARTIVGSHGGRIEVENNAGAKGVTFRIELPAAHAACSSARPCTPLASEFERGRVERSDHVRNSERGFL